MILLHVSRRSGSIAAPECWAMLLLLFLFTNLAVVATPVHEAPT
ncbi:MAG TPA: hypothetical protein VFH48_02800 [Chloroflexota bacterium]|nr:hypothetical protein [Chloroflexota bacterium]